MRKTGLVEGPTKNHTARTVPVPPFVARLLETEIADRDRGPLVFESARGGGYHYSPTIWTPWLTLSTLPLKLLRAVGASRVVAEAKNSL